MRDIYIKINMNNQRVEGMSNNGPIDVEGENAKSVLLTDLTGNENVNFNNFDEYKVVDNTLIHDPAPYEHQMTEEEEEEAKRYSSTQLREDIDMLTECVLEMSELVYA